MTDEPARAVTGYVKLGHDANAAIARVRDDLFDLFLRVVVAVGAELVQLRKLLALDAEALVFREVPVKDVHLHGRHRVEIALEHLHRLEVTRDVDHQPAPWKARPIVDLNAGKKYPLRSASSSCRRVSSPRSAPTTVGALSIA